MPLQMGPFLLRQPSVQYLDFRRSQNWYRMHQPVISGSNNNSSRQSIGMCSMRVIARFLLVCSLSILVCHAKVIVQLSWLSPTRLRSIGRYKSSSILPKTLAIIQISYSRRPRNRHSSLWQNLKPSLPRNSFLMLHCSLAISSLTSQH